MGLSGSLTTGEILEQIVHADRILAEEWEERHKENSSLQANNLRRNDGVAGTDEPKHDLVRNVVFMGMGEPLDNYTNVVDACRALIDRKRWNLAHGRVTVSTVGIISRIRKLTAELPEVSLALSLHAPNQALRSAIVPTAKHYPIEELIDALDGHMMVYLKRRYPAGTVFSAEQRIQESSRRRAMIEYVMLEGETSAFECAHQLGKLCENRQLVVNLIPYNQTDVKDKLRCPSDEHIEEFRRIVTTYGTFCTVRKTMGADIASACGQLITLDREKKENVNETSHRIETLASTENNGSTAAFVPDIEDAVPSLGGGNQHSPTRLIKSRRKEIGQEQDKNTAPVDDLEQWVRPLAFATAVAATCFVVSTYLFFKQRHR